jgi:hypothetical protein
MQGLQGSSAAGGGPQQMDGHQDEGLALGYQRAMQVLVPAIQGQGSQRALLADPEPVDQMAAAAAVWRAYYHGALTQWQHLPRGLSNATQVQPGMFPNNRNDSYVFAWPEKSCTGKVRGG